MTEHPTIHNDERMISQMGEQKSAKWANKNRPNGRTKIGQTAELQDKYCIFAPCKVNIYGKDV